MVLSYLTGVSQSVSVDGHLSDPLPVNIGVPQGSILGPLLFLLFLNYLFTITESCDINMLVDDTEIDSAAKPEYSSELESNVNIDLCKVKQYFDINRLSVNVQKCECLLIGIHQSIAKMADVRIHINNEPLKHVSVAKYLVMYIYSNLKWDDHINNMIPKISAKIPLFKKGSRNKSENYRPVSLTSVICKLLERLIKNHMVEFLVKHKLLNSSQHGFLKARSCLTNVLCFLEEITKWIDVGSPVDIIYLDFQKAFDKVPHQRLLLKLKAHGIGDSITDWIEQWLTDRRQRVVVDGEVSNWKSVLSGVPQGSVLGPILFLIYINDLDDSITSNVLKFADDTKLFRKVNTDGDKQHLQNDLDRLVKWSEKWQMLFNFGKCKCLHTGHRNLNVNYKMGDTVLGTTVKEKDLGVTISADMKVSEQCGIAASKGNQILGLIRRNITYKGKKLIIPLYKAIVRPHLEYCIQAWRPYRKKDIDTLERIQRRATKMIPELRDLSYEERLKECGLTTLETRRLRGDQIEVFKILNGYENIYRNMFFSLKKDSRTRGHQVKLVKDQCRLDIRKHSFSQRTINEWNKLSTDCVTASSVNMFKNKVDTYLRRAGYK